MEIRALLNFFKAAEILGITFGAGLVLAAGVGDFGSYESLTLAFKDDAGRIGAGAVGVCLLVFGAAFAFVARRGSSPHPDKSAEHRALAAALRGAVATPGEGETLKGPTQVVMTTDKMPPPGWTIWLFHVSGQGDRYWPDKIMEPDPGNPPDGPFKWKSLYVLTNAVPGEERRFRAFAVGPNGAALVAHFKNAGRAMSELKPGAPWTPIIAKEVPDDVVPLGRGPSTVRLSSTYAAA